MPRRSRPKPKRVIRSEFDNVEPPAGRPVGAQAWIKHALVKDKLRFQHTKLPQDCVRLLVLKPQITAEIHCDLREVSFDDLGKTIHYEALSYHWGANSQLTREPIFVDNSASLSGATAWQSEAGFDDANVHPLARRDRIWVHDNLFAALGCLRDEKEDVYIWVDAICINQENQEEKEAQVARMSDIYSKADTVLIWLGPGNPRTNRAMKFIDEILEIHRTQELITDATREIGLWRDLIYLLRRSWFSRRWVIQEVALAKDAIAICGHEEVNWLDLADAISIFVDNFDAIRSSFKRSEDFDNDFHALGGISPLPANLLVKTISNIFKRTGLGQDIRLEPIHGLEYLVSTLANFSTSDPRDTINCFRSLAKETYGKQLSGMSRPPPMDYKSELLQVYVGFIDWIYRCSRRIDILCRRWAHPESIGLDGKVKGSTAANLPTWILTIARDNFDDKYLGLRLHGDSFVGSPGNGPYNASYGCDAEIQFASCILPSSATASTGRAEKRPLNFLADSLRESDMLGTRTFQTSIMSAAEPPASLFGGQSSVEPATATRSHAPAVDTARPLNSSIHDPDTQAAKGLPEGDVLLSSLPCPSWKRTVDSAISTHLRGKLSKAGTSPKKPNLRREASLWIQGMVIGVVNWRTDPITDGLITENVVERLRGKTPENDESIVSDKFWRVLVAEKAPDGRQPPTTYRRACQYILDNNTRKYINTRDLLSKTQPPMVRDYLKRVQGVVWNRCFIEVSHEKTLQSDDGDSVTRLHGFSSSRTKVNDLLCILFGCSVPVILRPRIDDQIGQYYKFLGEAYVYGIMDGEALYSLEEDEIQQRKTEFRLL